jgi:superfamily II DNA/RNA helicase
MISCRTERSRISLRLLFQLATSTLRLPTFAHFPLHKSVHSFLEGNNIHTPTYIQYALLASLNNQPNAIRHITSPTGSGKTLAYLLPIINALKQ